MLLMQDNPDLLFADDVVKEEVDDGGYDLQSSQPSTSTYQPGQEEGAIHATDIFDDTPVKNEVKEEEIDEYDYQGTSQVKTTQVTRALEFTPTTSKVVKEEENADDKSNTQPPQNKPPVIIKQRTRWRAEEAPGWRNPVLIYKFLTINSFTKVKQMKCYTFSLNQVGFNVYVCNYCKSLGTTTVIGVSDGAFIRDPVQLSHACFPKPYEDELRVRTNYSSPQTQAEGLAFLDSFLDSPATANKRAEKAQWRHESKKRPMMLWDATVVQSRVGKNPTMYYRSYGDSNLCWSFMYQWERKNGTSIFVCAGCNKQDERVPIPVFGNKFCSDPSKLKHVCEPLYWPAEEEKCILREMKRKRVKDIAKEREVVKKELCLDDLVKKEGDSAGEPSPKQAKMEKEIKDEA